MSKHYFATDGNFGNAKNIAVLDTSKWNEEAWEEIDEASDNERINVARQIVKDSTTYLCTTELQTRLKDVALHLEEGNPTDAAAALKRILRFRMYLPNRQKIRKIYDEVTNGSPDKAEILISIFGM